MTTSTPAPGADPSMDEILASIRKILNEDETKTLPPADPAPPGRSDDVLILDESMMVPPAPPVPMQPSPKPDQAAASVPEAAPPPAPPVPAMEAALPLPPLVPMPPAGTAHPAGLVSPATAGAAGASVETLMRTLARERSTAVHRGGPTIEDLVREEMRPLLKGWLDAHLPPLVERLVRAEIERVVNRMAP